MDAKKIVVTDVDFIFNKIKKDFPPQTKEEHKILNNVRVLFEKNVTVKNDEAKKMKLLQLQEKLDEKFLDLCFMRKELIQKFREDYSASVSKIKNDVLYKCQTNSPDDYEKYKIKFNILKNEEFNKAMNVLPFLNSKLKKAKEILEESAQTVKDKEIDGDKYIEKYFRDI